jgi:hypothetical protein
MISRRYISGRSLSHPPRFTVAPRHEGEHRKLVDDALVERGRLEEHEERLLAPHRVELGQRVGRLVEQFGGEHVDALGVGHALEGLGEQGVDLHVVDAPDDAVDVELRGSTVAKCSAT